ncbi:MAG TPA: polyprenyl synthetase family protein [Proteiniphilum sp.]|nr:polyprenyl synthetase family protein [Proteiniphilum sp.]HPJ49575.1 polyprenyl synthetase family protein [Proteiniphilum sp.]HPR19977.1 polyprenyl synthetase family protein [Proteiniphilum sp.]
MLLFEEYLQASVKSDNPLINEMVGYLFNTSGKRLRPLLVLMTAKACGGIIPETYHGAVTVELLHTATLIHDDVIDKSDTRRGKRSLHAVYDNTQAVLLGDYLLSTALLESVKTKDLNIIRIISELGQNLAEGELNQFTLANKIIVDEDAYFEVIDKKTASLMRASIAIGAITGGADSEMITRFTQLGSILGICFQIRDDIFDYFTKDVGKPTGNDIREGKITLPLIYALQHAPEAISAEMMDIIKSRDYSDDNISRLLTFSKEQGGIDYAYGKMNALIENAEEMVSGFRLNEDMESLMRLFLTYLKDRRY